MKKVLLSIGVALLSASAGFAQKQWTLQECIDYAMANNITLQKSKLQKESATEDLKGAKAALLPTLSASTNQSLGYQPWKDSGMSYVTNGMVNAKVDKTSYNGSYSLSGQWTVWNGNRNLNTIKLDKLSEEQADLSTQETANSIQELTRILRDNHKLKEDADDDFTIRSQAEMMETMSSTMDTVTIILVVAAAFSLLVAGIGIMNIMLVSVTERTKEIGLRMAVGATGPVISLQFLIESVLISVTGGLIGVLVGVGASTFVSSFGMPSSVPAWSIYVSFWVCVFIGVLFGYIPAQKAANMDPIEAIRHE